MRETTRRLFCGLCGGGGLIRPGSICPGCEGAGYLPRLTLTIPVLSHCQTLPSDGAWWSRLAVLSSSTRDGRVLAEGISDRGRPAMALLEAHALAEARRVVFTEIEGWR
jgi:hypothetical protein